MDLTQALKVALADTFAFYLKAHGFHWNVTGPNFAEYHKFLGDVWEETFDAVDVIAEGIRTLDSFAPGSLSRFKELATIQDETKIPSAEEMISILEADNKKLLATLHKAYMIAEKDMKHGISNFIQDRITAHEKHGWMLRSFKKA